MPFSKGTVDLAVFLALSWRRTITTLMDGQAAWFAALAASGRSSTYRELCGVSFRKLFAYLEVERVRHVNDIGREHVRGWLTTLWQADLAHNTVATHEANVRAWCGWLVREGLMTTDPWAGMRRIQPIETVTAVPSPTDVQAMIDALLAKEEGLDKMKWRALRDIAILSVLPSRATARAISTSTHN